jgi:hypothetical protein
MIKQKVELVEACCGCSGENEYEICVADANTETEVKQQDGSSLASVPFLICKEKSGFFSRNCLE